MDVIFAISRVLVAWTVLFGLFSGVGLLLDKLLRLRLVAPGRSALLASLGWCGSIAFLQIWHLFLAADWRALVVLACVGTAGAILDTGRAVRAVRTNLKSRPLFAACLLLAGVWLANLATSQPQMGDSGLYHINSVKWACSYPIVPGLGNLHARLAFNQSFFLYVSMLDCGWFADKSHQVASGFLLFLGVMKSLGGLWRLVRNENRSEPGDVFDALFLVPVLGWATLSGYASTPTPDVAVFFLGFLLASGLFRLLCASCASDVSPKELSGTAMNIVLVVATGITVKFSFAVLGGAAVCVALCACHTVGRDFRSTLALALSAAGVGAVFIVPWMVRGVVLSGYVAFPSSLGSFPVEWRISKDMAHDIVRWIQAVGREKGAQSQASLDGWRWLWPWVNRLSREHMFDVVVPLGLAVLGAIGRCFWAFPREKGHRHSRLWLFFGPPLVALGFWFLTSPDPRFAGSAFWMLGAGSLTAFFLARRLNGAREQVVLLVVALVLSNINLPGSIDRWKRDHGPVHRGRTEMRTTDSGLEIHVPMQGDMCWNAPLPCTPYFNPRLRWREPGNMAKGFIIDPPVE